MTMQLGEHTVAITNFFENLSGGMTLNGTNSFLVENETTFPDLSELEGLEFSSCVITNDDNVRIPTQGFYTKVTSITVSYDDRSKLYTANILLG